MQIGLLKKQRTMASKKRNRPDHDGRDKSKVQKYKKFAKLNQEYCSICGLPINYDLTFPHPWSFTIDHVQAIVNGGTSSQENLAAAHLKCNRAKGTAAFLPIHTINMLRLEQGCSELLPESHPNTARYSDTNSLQDYLRTVNPAVVELTDSLNTLPNNDLPWSIDWLKYSSDE